MRRIRVLHLLPWIVSGGVEQRRLLLARHLSRDRFDLRFVCMQAAPPLSARIRAAGVQVDEISGTWTIFDLSSVRKLRRLIRTFDPDIVHGAVFEGVVMSVLSTLGQRKPKIIVEEIDYPVTRRIGGRALFATVANLADRCIGVSPAVGEYLKGPGLIAPSRVRVITNGAEEPSMADNATRERTRRELRLPEGAFVVGSVGRMQDAHKRFSDLLRTIPILLSQVPNFHLLLVGDGPDLPRLRALAKDLNVSDRVTFAGYSGDVGVMYALMDAFALVSNRESFGLVLAEAMFAGLPTICTGIGGMADVVVNQETGLYVSLGDTQGIADAIVRLHASPDLRARLGQAGQTRARSLFSAARYCNDVAKLYTELLGETLADETTSVAAE